MRTSRQCSCAHPVAPAGTTPCACCAGGRARESRAGTTGRGLGRTRDMSEDRRRWPLSPGQLGIWYGQRLNPDNVFVMSEYLEIHGAVDVALFEEALRRTVLEAETVQVRFAEDADGVWQFLAP